MISAVFQFKHAVLSDVGGIRDCRAVGVGGDRVGVTSGLLAYPLRVGWDAGEQEEPGDNGTSANEFQAAPSHFCHSKPARRGHIYVDRRFVEFLQARMIGSRGEGMTSNLFPARAS